MAQRAEHAAGAGGTHSLDSGGLCLLSLDGGGVRGLSALYILKGIMTRLNHERQTRGLQSVKPCQIFDLIGGTSTGGLIAIMLGRLEMDVDECISAYIDLMKDVFEEKSRFPVGWSGRAQPQFDSKKLKGAIERAVVQNGYSTTEKLNKGESSGCRTFVCATDKDINGPRLLKTYNLPGKPDNIRATICEAALATSAATGFFHPIRVGPRTFVDGALWANNPVDEMEREASNIWCRDTGDLKPLLKCFISIGTGKPGRKAIEDNLLKFFKHTLVDITTDTEDIAEKFIARYRGHYDAKRYFRFNVEQGLQEVGLAEYKEHGRIEAATEYYLDGQAVEFLVRDCVANLVQKQYWTPATLTTHMVQWTETDKACLRDLRVIDPRTDVLALEGSKEDLLLDAYRWILGTQEFRAFTNWGIDEASPPHTPPCRLLWINGLPGTGKTMLLMGVVHQLKSQQSRTTSYFFLQGTNQAKNNATAALKSLIWLLLQQQPWLISHLREDYESSGSKLFTDENAFYALSKAFQGMLQDPFLLPVYFVVDALDECDEALRERLLKLILDSLGRSEKVRWLVASRPDVDIQAAPGTLKKLQISRSVVELDSQRLDDPVNVYIDHKLKILKDKRGYNDAIVAQVSDEVRRRAMKTFLWVALVFKELNKVNGWKALKTIGMIPSGLESLYNHMMTRIENMSDPEHCRDVLVATSLAYRPLSIPELTVLSGLPANVDLPTIVEECCSFLKITDGTVHLIHQSAKDYLDQNHESKLQQRATQGHTDLSRRSIFALSTTLRKNIYDLPDPGFNPQNLSPLNDDPLASVRYSCVFWVDHLCDGQSDSKTDLADEGLVQEFSNHHFLHWIESLSLLDKYSDGVQSITKLLQNLQSDKQPGLYSLLSDARRFTLNFRSIIEKAPLQTYSSALIFSPAQSTIRNRFFKEVPTWIKNEGLPVVVENWSPCLHTLEGHTNSVTSVAFSPDGNLLASGSCDGTVRLWDPTMGAALHTLEGHSSPVEKVVFSPDGSQLASCSFDMVRLWNPTTGEILQTQSFEDAAGYLYRGFLCLAFSPNGIQVAKSSGLTVQLCNLTTELTLQTLEVYKGPPRSSYDKVRCLAFSPDGSQLATGSSSMDCFTFVLLLWNSATGTMLHALAGHAGSVYAIAFSPDGKQLASGSADHTIRIWDPIKGTMLRTLEGHTDGVYGLAFSEGGDLLASKSHDRTVRLWEPTGAALHTLKGYSIYSRGLAFSPDSSRIVASFDNMVRIEDPAAGMIPDTLEGHTDYINELVFSPDSSRLASASGDYTVRLWDPTTIVSQPTMKGKFGRLRQVTFSADGNHLASLSWNGIIQLWSLATGAELYNIRADDTGSSDTVAFSPDGSLLASGSNGPIRLWNPTTGAALKTLGGPAVFDPGDPSVTGGWLEFSPDGSRLAFKPTFYKEVRLWDIASGIQLHVLKGHTVRVGTFSPDGSQLAYGLGDKSVRLWDSTTGAELYALENDGRSNITALAFSPDGSQLAVGAEKRIELWNPTTRKLLRVFGGFVQFVKALAFSPDSSRLASSDTSRAQLWDLATGTALYPQDCHPNLVSEAASFSSHDSRRPLYLLDSSGRWITRNNVKALLLPPDRQASACAIYGNKLAIGHGHGRLTIVEFD